MKTVFLIALGGGLGSVARYLTGKISFALWGADFPWGTMIVNVVGSLAIGIVAGLLAHFTSWSQDVRHFVVVGILGGFTTFSAFALDSLLLYERQAYGAALFYIAGSVIISILAVAAGMFIIRSSFA